MIALTCTGCKISVKGSHSYWSVVCHSFALVQIIGQGMTCLQLHTAEVNHTAPRKRYN